MLIACACAKPKPDVLAYSSPFVAAPFAASVYSRELNFDLIAFYAP